MEIRGVKMNMIIDQKVDSGVVFSPCEAASYCNCKVVGSGRRRRSQPCELGT